MRVTTKGQVTIPLAVRAHLGIAAGDEVTIVVRDGEAVLRPARGVGERLAERLTGAATSRAFRSTDEILRLTRGDD